MKYTMPIDTSGGKLALTKTQLVEITGHLTEGNYIFNSLNYRPKPKRKKPRKRKKARHAKKG